MSLHFWIVDTEEDGRITLIAPNGHRLLTVPPEVADMVGRMLIDEAVPLDEEEQDVGLDARGL